MSHAWPVPASVKQHFAAARFPRPHGPFPGGDSGTTAAPISYRRRVAPVPPPACRFAAARSPRLRLFGRSRRPCCLTHLSPTCLHPPPLSPPPILPPPPPAASLFCSTSGVPASPPLALPLSFASLPRAPACFGRVSPSWSVSSSPLSCLYSLPRFLRRLPLPPRSAPRPSPPVRRWGRLRLPDSEPDSESESGSLFRDSLQFVRLLRH